jgi:hypothetical protein
MHLDDPNWKTLEGGYRVPYDASVPLRALAEGDDGVFPALWENLYHQGDVGDASYAAVPALARIFETRARTWDFYALVNIIEISRHKENPPLPAWLEPDYRASLDALLTMALADVRRSEDDATLQEVLASIAVARGNPKLAEFISFTDQSEIDLFLAGRFAWTEAT